MSEVAVFLWIMIGVVAIGALAVKRHRDPVPARREALLFTALGLIAALAAWWRFAVNGADSPWGAGLLTADVASLGWRHFVGLDELNAPLVPLAGLLYLLTILATPPTKLARVSFSAMLFSQAVLLATFTCQAPWVLIGLLCLGLLPPAWELRARGRNTRVYVRHMTLFAVCLTLGWALESHSATGGLARGVGLTMLVAAVMLRSGIFPLHGWTTDLFSNATFSTALLFMAPMVGTYAAVRLVLPVAPVQALRGLAVLSLVTAVYTAGMALVQRDARRFFCYLFLSHSSLVLVGLEMVTPLGLTGALCLWLSVGLSLGGFGLTLRSIEARTGLLSLNRYHGLYDHLSSLAVFFLLTGLASIGFPGTIGFVGTELLVDGVAQIYPVVGAVVAIVAALNGIAVVYAYFRIFTGTRPRASFSLGSRLSERIAVTCLAALILGGGLAPQPGVASRYRAALGLITSRGEIRGWNRTNQEFGLLRPPSVRRATDSHTPVVD